MEFDLRGRKIFVAGHKGMVGSAIVRRLESESCTVVTASRGELDLTRQEEVEKWMTKNRPEAIFLAAAKVGGILANESYPADFLYENLALETNIIHAAHLTGVEKLLFLGSSCIYPKYAKQPIEEDSLLSGSLEQTNEWYAIAKIAGIKLCQAYRRQHGRNFISAMPTNLYGPGDNYDLSSSHVMPALMRKAHESKAANKSEMVIWGTGSPKREFLHVDDCADACVFLMKYYSNEQHINIGCGEDISIIDLARMVAEIVGYKGQISNDLTKPDGTPRKLMSSVKLREMGWAPNIPLEMGIRSTYQSFLAGEKVERQLEAINGQP